MKLLQWFLGAGLIAVIMIVVGAVFPVLWHVSIGGSIILAATLVSLAILAAVKN